MVSLSSRLLTNIMFPLKWKNYGRDFYRMLSNISTVQPLLSCSLGHKNLLCDLAVPHNSLFLQFRLEKNLAVFFCFCFFFVQKHLLFSLNFRPRLVLEGTIGNLSASHQSVLCCKLWFTAAVRLLRSGDFFSFLLKEPCVWLLSNYSTIKTFLMTC